MKLSKLLMGVVIAFTLCAAAYAVSCWLHTNTIAKDHIRFDNLLGIILAVFFIIAITIAVVIRFWPTWYRRLATAIVTSILGAETFRWIGVVYLLTGQTPPSWILVWFGPASSFTAAAAFLCVAVLAGLDYLTQHARSSPPDEGLNSTKDSDGERPAVPPSSAPLSRLELKARRRYLQELREDVEARLKESIHNARFIDLDLEDNPTATVLPFRYKSPSQKEFGSIEEAFTENQQRILILGAPGSGKTTTLLHIVKQLTEAAADPNEPIPLLVNLSKFNLQPQVPWFRLGRDSKDRDVDRNRDSEFERWLEGEFARFPGVDRRLANKWIAEQRVAVMLDGLDEVDDEYRLEMVDVLNGCRVFQMAVPVVLCSRVHEYQAIQSRGSKLHLQGAVTLQPLTPEQIDDYLDAAQATSLKNSLPGDEALYEMARTPLTLSMMTLAYGGMAPDSIPENLSLTERRHHLMEAYVTRMLQRKERRDRNQPFDEASGNDVPEREYSYSPKSVNHYLSWLAISLSIRMQTAFSMRQFYTFLMRECERDRRPAVFWSTAVAYSTLLVAATLAMGSAVVPISLHSFGQLLLLAMASGVLFLFADQHVANYPRGAGAARLKAVRVVVQISTICIAVAVGAASLSYSMAAIIPVGWSPIAMGQLTFCLSNAILGLACTYIRNSFVSPGAARLAKWTMAAFTIALLVVNLSHLTSHNGLLVSTAVVLTQAAWVAFEAREDDRIHVLYFILFMTVVIGIHAICVWFIAPAHWSHGVVMVCATAVATLGMTRTAIPVIFLLFLSASVGGLVASNAGMVIACALLGFLVILSNYLTEVSHDLVELYGSNRIRSVVAGTVGRLNDRLLEGASHLWLSPMLRRILVFTQNMPVRWQRFLDYTTGALLLKRSAGDIEFVHRMLRDHFAMRELISKLRETPDFDHRLNLIRSLGFQGESSLSPLSEYAIDHDPDVRVAAIDALARVSHPTAVERIQYLMNDPEPRVRCAAVQACQFLPGDATEAVIELALDDSDTSVQLTLAQSARKICDVASVSRRHVAADSVLLKLLSRTTVQSVLVEIVANFHDVEKLSYKLPEWGCRYLPSLLRNRNAEVRIGSLIAMGRRPKFGDPELIALTYNNDSAPRVRAAAVFAISRLGGQHASEILTSGLSDEAVEVRKATVFAILYGRIRDQALMHRSFRSSNPRFGDHTNFRDPKDRITNRDVKEAAKELGQSEVAIRHQYEALAVKLDLRLEWRPPS